MFKNVLRVVAILTLIRAQFVHAAVGRIDASHEGIFTTYGCSVIVARVEKLWSENQTNEAMPKERALLIPQVTVAGTFDPSLNESLTVEYFESGTGTSIVVPPKEGDLILVVVRIQVLIADDPKPRNLIASERCLFMPDRASLIVLKGTDDSRIGETLKRIQVARAKAKKDPK